MVFNKGYFISTHTDTIMDSDLRQYQREMALSAISSRYPPKKPASLTVNSINNKKQSEPLFDLDSDDESVAAIRNALEELESEEDEELALAIQASLDQSRSTSPWKASGSTVSPHKLAQESLKFVGVPSGQRPSPEVEILAPSGLETFLTFAGTGTSREFIKRRVSGTHEQNKVFGAPSPLLAVSKTALNAVLVAEDKETPGGFVQPVDQPVSSTTPASIVISGFQALTDSEDEMEEVEIPVVHASADKLHEVSAERPKLSSVLPLSESKDNEDLEEIEVPVLEPTLSSGELASSPRVSTESSPRKPIPFLLPDNHNHTPDPGSVDVSSVLDSTQVIETPISAPMTPVEQDNTSLSSRSRSLSPSVSRQMTQGFGQSNVTSILRGDAAVRESEAGGESIVDIDEQLEGKHWDAAEEMDLRAEEGEFARFLSQVKGRNLNDVRREIDDEIKGLNEQRKAAMRDSEDITQQMVSQIMVSLDPIRYGPGTHFIQRQC